PQLIVTSPLYRTLQTTTIAFEHLNIPMIANPDIQETKAGILDCDTGIEAEILKKKFPNVVMDHLEKNWYLPQVNVETRIQRFKKWLNERKEQIIVVVSHAVSKLMSHNRNIGYYTLNDPRCTI
ncbi:MAG TPA: histidine phosphatase family protein, partial [Taishania sp.]|nr:histidine phosphatase family protein [Taishania sp.]